MTQTAFKQLASYLSGQGLKATRQRDEILKAFIKAGRHVSADELYQLVKKAAPGIGYATVYRTLRLLTVAGLAHEQRFEDGFTRYEYNTSNSHHDHLICTMCGTIIEFANEQIERLQQDVALKNQFLVKNHKLELYGLCKACQNKNRR